MHTRLTNSYSHSDRANLIWQLHNLEASMRKHAEDSPEFRYLVKERVILLDLLEEKL